MIRAECGVWRLRDPELSLSKYQLCTLVSQPSTCLLMAFKHARIRYVVEVTGVLSSVNRVTGHKQEGRAHNWVI